MAATPIIQQRARASSAGQFWKLESWHQTRLKKLGKYIKTRDTNI